MSSPKPLRLFGLLAFLGVVGGLLVLLPSSLGGSTTWLATTGASMEPALHTGALVVARPADRYEVGDVVAYRSASLAGTVVLHRIVDTSADGFVTQGDNNDWLDPDHPQQADILGELWIHVPGGARMLSILANPFLVAAALLALTGAGLLGHRRRRRSRAGSRASAPAGTLSMRALGARVRPDWVAVTAFLALGLAVLAFTRPAEVSGPRDLPYTHVAEIDYGAPTSARSVYPEGRVSTGDPVFPRLTPVLDVALDYRVEGIDTAASGTVRAAAVIRAGNGWTRELTLTPPATFEGREAAHTARLDLRQVLDIAARAEREAGTSFGSTTVDVVFQVRVEGEALGEATTFRPQLRFSVDGLQALPETGESDDTSDGGSVRVVDEAVVSGSTWEPNTVGVLRWEVPVPALRALSVVLGALALLLAALLALAGSSGDRRPRFGGRLVEAADYDTAGRTVIEVPGPEPLARVAEVHDTVVVAAHGRFYVAADAQVYLWQPRHLRPAGAQSA